MKESGFIQQNKEKWIDFEKNLKNKSSDPKETSRLFIQITDDLSYSRTFYKNRSVRAYLNGISKLLFNSINKRDRTGIKDIAQFWKTDLPLAMYAARRAMLISNIVFWGCFLLGVVSSIVDPDFAKSILGAGYINMTNENIEAGTPMAVYDSDDPLGMFWYIMMNNIRIDFYTFFSGLLSSVGTISVMVVNGVMVGVFQYFFIEKGLFWESFLSIWTHGTLEISTIILTGGAGIVMGKGMLFPGTYSRFQAFRMSAQQGLKILMGVLPLTIFAAFIESFVTRHTDLPDVLRLVFILFCLTFVLLYFWWYPRWLVKRIPNINERLEIKPIVRDKHVFDRYKILGIGEVFAASIRVFTRKTGIYMMLTLASAGAFGILIGTDPLGLFFESEEYYGSFRINNLFDYDQFPLLGVASFIVHFVLTISVLLYSRHVLLYNDKIAFSIRNSNFGKTALSALLASPVYIGLIAINEWWSVILAILILPLLSISIVVSNYQNIGFFQSISQTSALLNKNWGKMIGLTVLYMILWFILFIGNNFLGLLIQSTRGADYGTMGFIPAIVADFISMLITNEGDTSQNIQLITSSIFVAFNYLFAYTLSLIGFSILFFTMKESNTAEYLNSRINNIKAKK
ncbi:MAG: stage II sporulation protein M [Flavobacteriales bacterium]|nr:stage II sporulation protein M [Flavobacteriales bacterium]